MRPPPRNRKSKRQLLDCPEGTVLDPRKLQNTSRLRRLAVDGYLTRVLRDSVELFVRTARPYEPPDDRSFDFQAHRRRFEEH